ncbi:MAG: fumarate hydratase [Nitrospirae bacterium]|nr:fumarate hydratase [Nitrospirota bacterium]
MKEIHFNDIADKIAQMCIDAACNLDEDILSALDRAIEIEKSTLGIEVLRQLKENAEIARNESLPVCQDTGMALFFVEYGEDVKIKGGLLNDAINEGVRQGYKKGYLRKSIVNDPITRRNTQDNTPAIIHTELVAGNNLKINFKIVGAGCENMSKIKMLKPTEGIEGIKSFVIDTVKEGGINACPPLIIGVGLGGNFEMCAILSKKSLMRPIGQPNKRMEIASLEEDILKDINKLGIGPAGFGGRVTALAVHIETYPCHIASLPVAVNLNCHASRKKALIL